MSTDLDTAFAAILDSWWRGQHKAMPGIVTAFTDRLAGRISVQPAWQRVYYGDDTPRNLPVIEDVPVVYSGAGDLWLVYDLAVGSPVLLLIPDRSMASWLDKGGVVDPEFDHTSDLSDCLAIAGPMPSPLGLLAPVATGTIAMRNRAGTLKVELEGSNVTIQNGASSLVVDATSITAQAAQVKVGNGSDFVAMATKTDLVRTTIASVATGQVCAAPGVACPFAAALMAALNLLQPPGSTNLKAD